MARKSNYGYGKWRPYRSYKKRISSGDKLVGILLLLCIVLWILKVILQIIVTYYYVFIALALICLIICFIKYNHKSKSFQFKCPSKNKKITSDIYTNPEKTSPKTYYYSEEQLLPEAYEAESLEGVKDLKGVDNKGVEDLKDCESDLNKESINRFEPGLESENVEKGDKFERYVVDRFDNKLFSVVEWTTDMSRKHNRFVESDCNPDLVIRDRKTNEIFCVECKYRSRLVNGYFDWSYPDQMDRYFSYARERKIPFHIVLGFGGSPDSPLELFCVPLEEAKNPQIHISTLQKYYHDPRRDFLWKSGTLK